MHVDSPQAKNLLQFVDTIVETSIETKKKQFDLLMQGFIDALQKRLCTGGSPVCSNINLLDALSKHKKNRQLVESAIYEFYGSVVLRYLHTINDSVFEDGIDMLLYNYQRIEKMITTDTE